MKLLDPLWRGGGGGGRESARARTGESELGDSCSHYRYPRLSLKYDFGKAFPKLAFTTFEGEDSSRL